FDREVDAGDGHGFAVGFVEVFDNDGHGLLPLMPSIAPSIHSFPSSAWERTSGSSASRVLLEWDEPRSSASHPCVPKQSLGTRIIASLSEGFILTITHARATAEPARPLVDAAALGYNARTFEEKRYRDSRSIQPKGKYDVAAQEDTSAEEIFTDP